jgi:kynurenine 3-monooxygenase
MKNITIVGGGLVGSLLAIFLAKKGYKINIYERRPDLRKENIAVGRSINLVISHRGWNALKAAGIEEEIKEITVPVYARMTHDLQGNQTKHPYSIENKAIWSVSRGGLNAKLLSIAENFPNVSLHFNYKCTEVNLDKASASFENTLSNETIIVESDLLFGADGAFSAVRQIMMQKDRFNYSIEYIEHGYKELVIPANNDGSYKLDKNCLHIWPRREFMLMALANLDGSFTCTLFFPYEGEQSFNRIKNENDLINFFKETFPDAINLMPTLVNDFFENKTSSLAIVRCSPWVHNGKIALIGDAAHAIVPFYGEGMNCGFEDCFIFNSLLEKMGDKDLHSLLNKYNEMRKPNGDAIADLSLRNFVEMRHLVAEPTFILRKKIENKMQEKHPDKWLPLYSQVKFSNIQYCNALNTSKKQDEIMEKILSIKNIEENWDSSEVENQILNLLQ